MSLRYFVHIFFFILLGIYDYCINKIILKDKLQKYIILSDKGIFEIHAKFMDGENVYFFIYIYIYTKKKEKNS